MRMFSNDIRVANTASPSFQSQANVSQYGWTGADQGHYNQLIQYVDECRKIWLSMEEKIAYVEEILEQVAGVDAQIQYINLVAAEMTKWRTEVLAARDQVERMYEEVKPLYNQFQIDYTDFSKKYTNVVKLHGEAVVAASSAATSETNAAKSAKDAADIAEELRKGQVYRGTWNIQANAAYPPKPDTNSVWDVVLNEGSLEFRFDNTLWYWGDRLLFLKDDDQFTQIEAGGSVTSVNGKKGAVTISYPDVHAAPEGFGLGGYGESLSGTSANDTTGSGFYGIFSGTTDTPYTSGGPSGSQLLNMEWGKAGATQLFSSYTSDRLHFRRKYQEVWQPWHEIYTTAKKPTPSELGALNKAGDTIEGNLNIGAGARIVLNNTVLMGANNSPFLRDHGNGNVTISASSTSGGVAGDLYIGYTGAALSGTTGYNTRSVKLYAPMTWSGSGSTIVDDKGINSEFMQGPIRTEKDSSNILHTIVGGTDTLNRGRTLIAGGECGKTIYDNTTSGAESVHIGGDGTDGVYIHTGLQNGWTGASGSTHYRYQFKQGEIFAGADMTKRFYHQGFIPTAGEVGALGNKGTQTLDGSLLINPGTSSDSISLTQTFNPTGANAQGISGYNSKDTAKRAWGVGAYAGNGIVEYAYLGVGESPWATGFRIRPTAIEAYQPLYVNGTVHTTAPNGGEMFVLNYNAGTSGGNIRGKSGGTNDWYVGRANELGDVALYSNTHNSGVVIRDDGIEFTKLPRYGGGGTIFATQHASSLDLNILSDATKHGMFYQDANANATPARNYPIAEAGALVVMGGAYGALQEYTTFSSNRKFIRGKNAAGSAAASWRPWQELGGIKDHCSAYRITAQNIPVNGTGILVPGVFPSAQGITSSNGDFNIAKGGTYKIDWGFSIEPTGANQNGVGSIWVNGSKQHDVLIYNYCPASGTGAGQATQMGTASTSVITKLNAGDKVSFRVAAVNNTTVRIYQAGYMTITQL